MQSLVVERDRDGVFRLAALQDDGAGVVAESLTVGIDSRQHFQGLTFPERMKWDGERFQTPVTHFFLRCLQPEKAVNDKLVTPRGFEPR